MVLCTEIKVRGYHLDFYGHVNNARYLEFMEEARWALFDQRIDLGRYLGGGVTFIIVNININYRKTAGLGDILECYVGFKEMGDKSATLTQNIILKGKGHLVADAEVTFVLAGGPEGKAVAMTDEFKALLMSIK